MKPIILTTLVIYAYTSSSLNKYNTTERHFSSLERLKSLKSRQEEVLLDLEDQKMKIANDIWDLKISLQKNKLELKKATWVDNDKSKHMLVWMHQMRAIGKLQKSNKEIEKKLNLRYEDYEKCCGKLEEMSATIDRIKVNMDNKVFEIKNP